MKKFLGLGVLLFLIAPASFACDEACVKQNAAEEHSVNFPGYLSWKYCEGIKSEFMGYAMKSLKGYRVKRMDSKRKQSMKTIKEFLAHRKEWLEECDQYTTLTGKGRLFKDETTSDDIYYAIDSVNRELGSLISGVTYASIAGEDSSSFAGEKFDEMFKLVDQHKTRVQLDEQFVTR